MDTHYKLLKHKMPRYWCSSQEATHVGLIHSSFVQDWADVDMNLGSPLSQQACDSNPFKVFKE